MLLELEEERERALTVPKYTPEEKQELMKEKGAGLCSNRKCMRLGPFNEWCAECFTEGDINSKHMIDEEALNLLDDEGICPVCCKTGKLNEFCKGCEWWFYIHIPDEWIKDH